MSKADDEATWKAIKGRLATRRNLPAKARPPAADGSALVLGLDEKDHVVTFARTARLQHAHVVGTVGSGKSKFLEHCIRQDIAAGLGVCVIDPHGHHPDSLFRSLLSWIGAGDRAKSRPVHVILAAHGDFQRDGEDVWNNTELLEAAMRAGIRFADRPAFKKRLRESGEWSHKEMQDFSIVCSISLLDCARADLVRILEYSNPDAEASEAVTTLAQIVLKNLDLRVGVFSCSTSCSEL